MQSFKYLKKIKRLKTSYLSFFLKELDKSERNVRSKTIRKKKW